MEFLRVAYILFLFPKAFCPTYNYGYVVKKNQNKVLGFHSGQSREYGLWQ